MRSLDLQTLLPEVTFHRLLMKIMLIAGLLRECPKVYLEISSGMTCRTKLETVCQISMPARSVRMMCGHSSRSAAPLCALTEHNEIKLLG